MVSLNRLSFSTVKLDHVHVVVEVVVLTETEMVTGFGLPD